MCVSVCVFKDASGMLEHMHEAVKFTAGFTVSGLVRLLPGSVFFPHGSHTLIIKHSDFYYFI